MQFRPGDIFACYGADLTSRIIQAGTYWPIAPRRLRWPPSHVAIAAWDADQAVRWFESTTMTHRRCLIRHTHVQGVQCHPVADQIENYIDAGGRVDVYRLVDIDALDEWEAWHLSRLLCRFVEDGARYDALGAALSGLRVTQLLHLLPGADLETLFCSEVISAVLMRLCRMNRDNPTRYNPGRLLRTLLYQGTYRFEHSYHDPIQLCDFEPSPPILPFARPVRAS